MVYAVTRFVYESWKFHEVAQGLIKVPIWIPQVSFALGVAIFFIAIVDGSSPCCTGRRRRTRSPRTTARDARISRDGVSGTR